MTFKKGQSGNPKGRPPKGTALTDLFNEYLNENDGERRKQFIKKAYDLAISGDSTLFKYIWDRIDGKIKEELGVTIDQSLSDWVKKVSEENE